MLYVLLLLGTTYDYIVERRIEKANRAQYTNKALTVTTDKLSAQILHLHHGRCTS